MPQWFNGEDAFAVFCRENEVNQDFGERLGHAREGLVVVILPLQGVGDLRRRSPRALPWAVLFRPLRGGVNRLQCRFGTSGWEG